MRSIIVGIMLFATLFCLFLICAGDITWNTSKLPPHSEPVWGPELADGALCLSWSYLSRQGPQDRTYWVKVPNSGFMYSVYEFVHSTDSGSSVAQHRKRFGVKLWLIALLFVLYPAYVMTTGPIYRLFHRRAGPGPNLSRFVGCPEEECKDNHSKTTQQLLLGKLFAEGVRRARWSPLKIVNLGILVIILIPWVYSYGRAVSIHAVPADNVRCRVGSCFGYIVMEYKRGPDWQQSAWPATYENERIAAFAEEYEFLITYARSAAGLSGLTAEKTWLSPFRWMSISFPSSAESLKNAGSVESQRLSNWLCSLVVPYWFLWLILALWPVTTVMAGIRARVRDDKGLCSECGYDLTGLPNSRCPECGSEIQDPDKGIARI